MSDELNLSPGEVLFEEGDPSDAAYVVLSGEVQIIQRSDRGELELARMGLGDIFGEMGLIDERPRSAGARALNEVKVRKVRSEQFADMLLHQPMESIGYVQVLLERLRSANAKLRQLEARLGDAEERQTTVQEKMPRHVMLMGTSDEAKKALAHRELMVERFPFRIGRRSNRPDHITLAYNDLYIDDQRPYEVSRHHVTIERCDAGLVISDRGSHFGCLVNGTRVGGDAPISRTLLQDGDNELILGTRHSPYRFNVHISL